ncbi:PTS sugar transporter subunit IIB [Caldisalinibacter kiritimatiensis]|uniref:Putative sugar phosphotransferase component II B n=1 Tax=Caldisalinibacter kiritimatiensis TaxID=1304284 RepID=R1ATQ2_9FIRM|nr:PTS sugar transporter subunit IIB [Caldisalinibacter kiritimatiensis]EOD00012.1 Putative sugar phosphotransferase component II B [Caldisalinibacter kiritimatiensis]
MYKILVCCGSGLGSSFMIEMNIKKILKELNVENVEVDHADLSSASGSNADIYVGTRDIAANLEALGDTVSLNSMIDMNELKEKLTAKLKEKEII